MPPHTNNFSAFYFLLGSSCALNFNNITGPAMVVLPLLYQQAGWLLPSVALLTLWALSCVASAMLCEAMQRIPGNLAFARRFEYCPLVRHYLGKQCYYAAMVSQGKRLRCQSGFNGRHLWHLWDGAAFTYHCPH